MSVSRASAVYLAPLGALELVHVYFSIPPVSIQILTI